MNARRKARSRAGLLVLISLTNFQPNYNSTALQCPPHRAGEAGMAHYIGLDLGGTNIKAGVVDDTGTSLGKVSCPTGAEGGPEQVIAAMKQAADDAAARAGIPLALIDAIGIVAPGQLDMNTGVVVTAPNLPG